MNSAELREAGGIVKAQNTCRYLAKKLGHIFHINKSKRQRDTGYLYEVVNRKNQIVCRGNDVFEIEEWLKQEVATIPKLTCHTSSPTIICQFRRCLNPAKDTVKIKGKSLAVCGFHLYWFNKAKSNGDPAKYGERVS